MHQRTYYAIIGAMLLSLLSMTTALANSHKITPTFNCAGTHPAWSLNIENEKFLAETPSAVKLLLNPVKPLPAAGMHLSYMRIYETTSKDPHQPVTIVIKDDPEGCTDGQSATLHGYDVVMSMPGKAFSGCCDILDNSDHVG